jgi:hypothetical protein
MAHLKIHHKTWVSFVSIGIFAMCLFFACSTPKRSIRLSEKKIIKEKIPLTAAVVMSSERREKIWKPDIELQGYVRRDVHAGKTLLEVVQNSMGFVFGNVLEARSVQEGRNLGADVLIGVSCQITAKKKPAILTTQVELFVTDPQEANLDSFTEEGTYNHFWTAVDDGAVNNALVQACEKIIPRLLASPALKRYADGLRGKPEIRDTMHTQPLPEVMIHDVYLAPLDSSEKRIDIAHKGQPFDMVILYSISGLPQNKRMACLEKRQISFGGKILLEDKRMEQRGNGDYSTSIKLTLPHAAQAGDYVLSGVIQWEDKELSKSFRFSIE